MTKSIRERLGELSSTDIEGLVYFIGAFVAFFIIVGLIVWQLILMGQIFGVIFGLITFSALIALLFVYFRVEGKGDNPRLALMLRIAATIIFFIFLFEAIFTLINFYTPVLRPLFTQLLINISIYPDAAIIGILLVIVFIIIVIAFLMIPACLWTGLCRASNGAEESTSPTQPSEKKPAEPIASIKCSACGSDLTGNEGFCGNCGVAVTKK